MTGGGGALESSTQLSLNLNKQTSHHPISPFIGLVAIIALFIRLGHDSVALRVATASFRVNTGLNAGLSIRTLWLIRIPSLSYSTPTSEPLQKAVRQHDGQRVYRPPSIVVVWRIEISLVSQAKDRALQLQVIVPQELGSLWINDRRQTMQAGFQDSALVCSSSISRAFPFLDKELWFQ